jgi:hypothetical protein
VIVAPEAEVFGTVQIEVVRLTILTGVRDLFETTVPVVEVP